MKKVKGQGRLTKMLASKIAAFNKDKFKRYIDDATKLAQLSKELYNNTNIDIEIVSFSSSFDFAEQILSILSFIKYVGLPIRWTLYSDGTHTNDQLNLLKTSFEFLEVINIADFANYVEDNISKDLLQYKQELKLYAKNVPLGKRMFLYLNFDIKRPTLFIDSDIVFYSKAGCIKDILATNYNGWFLPDFDWGCLDSRYMLAQAPQPYQVNGGMFLVNKNLEHLAVGMDFFRSLGDKYEYFSDQNVFHILLLANGFMPFDPRIFILNSGDQFDMAYSHKVEEMAIRHYTGPVRHKMWQKSWKWHLSL